MKAMEEWSLRMNMMIVTAGGVALPQNKFSASICDGQSLVFNGWKERDYSDSESHSQPKTPGEENTTI